MNEIIQTLQGTISRLNEDNEQLGAQYHIENEKIIVLERMLKEYKRNRSALLHQVTQNEIAINQMNKYLEQMELVAQWG